MHQRERNSNFSALYFVIYESKNVHKLEVVDLQIYLIPLLKFPMSMSYACDVHNYIVVINQYLLNSSLILEIKILDFVL